MGKYRPAFYVMQSLPLLGLLFFVPVLFADFNQTTGTKTDASKFGGMSDEEVEQQLAKEMQNAYLRAVYERIKKFDDGGKSSKFDKQGGNGSGYYSGYGEAHIENGDSMISHDGGANALESAVERGALGQTGLQGQKRLDAEQKEMDKATTQIVNATGPVTFRNNLTGQIQDRSFEISAALQDAGPAHGSGANGANDSHRVYVVKDGVRTQVEANAGKYADAIKNAATEPGKQMNFDLAQKIRSKLEQDKYIMMASDAIAFKAARYDGTDTTDPSSRPVIGEYKQIAIDAYAEFPGDIKAAEVAIRRKTGERIAKKRVINDASLVICNDGSIKKDNICGSPDPVNPTTPQIAAKEILNRFGVPNPDSTKQLAMEKLIRNEFPGGNTTPKSVSDLMKKIPLKSLSGLLSREKLDSLYLQAEQNMGPDEKKQMVAYEDRLSKCMNFETMCYSGQGALPASALTTVTGATPIIDKNIFQDVKTLGGDPGNYFTDTRELIYNQFAYAYDKPLAQWKNIVTSADFNKSTDKNIKGDGKTYAEFEKMYQAAMDNAEEIQRTVDSSFTNRLQSGSAPGTKVQVQGNYAKGAKNSFDAQRNSFMQLYGQNKDRDAVAMDWRKTANRNNNNLYMDPTVRGPAANKKSPVNTSMKQYVPKAPAPRP